MSLYKNNLCFFNMPLRPILLQKNYLWNCTVQQQGQTTEWGFKLHPVYSVYCVFEITRTLYVQTKTCGKFTSRTRARPLVSLENKNVNCIIWFSAQHVSACAVQSSRNLNSASQIVIWLIMPRMLHYQPISLQDALIVSWLHMDSDMKYVFFCSSHLWLIISTLCGHMAALLPLYKL